MNVNYILQDSEIDLPEYDMMIRNREEKQQNHSRHEGDIWYTTRARAFGEVRLCFMKMKKRNKTNNVKEENKQSRYLLFVFFLFLLLF